MKHTYTHKDESGMLWRFVGSRPVSKLADEVMELVEVELAEGEHWIKTKHLKELKGQDATNQTEQ